MFEGRMDLKMDMNLNETKFEENTVTENNESNINIEDNSKSITSNRSGGLVMVNDANVSNNNDVNNDTQVKVNNDQANDQNTEQGGGLDIKMVFIGLLLGIYYLRNMRK